MAVSKRNLARKACAAAVAAATVSMAGSAFAIEFSTDSGWNGTLTTTIGYSAQWRAESPDKELIIAKNAAAAGLVSGVTATPGVFPGVSFSTDAATAAAIGGAIAATPAGATPAATAAAAAGAAAAAAVASLPAGTVPAAAAPGLVLTIAGSLVPGLTQALTLTGNSPVVLMTSGVAGLVAARTQIVGGALVQANLTRAAALGVAQGFLGGQGTDDADVNYKKNKLLSSDLKVFSELAMSKGDMGFLIRAKGWYDDALQNQNTTVGNQASGYQFNKPISDDGFNLLNRFEGVALLDAYVYKGFDVAEMPAQVRLGRQAVNWGESIFVQGVNQLSPLDVSALRKAGTEIKEALLPVWSITGNIGLPGGASLEGFYQFKWERTNVDQCGTYWSPIAGNFENPGACNQGTTVGFNGLSSYSAFLGSDNVVGGLDGPSGLAATATSIGAISGTDGKNSGQWGLALKFPVEALDTEFGLYAENITSRIPIVSSKVAGAAFSSNVSANTVGFWEYPDNIKIFGLSASTTIGGVSVGAELSYQKDVPVQINANDGTVAGALAGTNYAASLGLTTADLGPAAARAAAARATLGAASTVDAAHGAYVQGYDRYDKTQFQINGVKVLPAMLGAQNGLLVGEAAFQWNDVPSSNGYNVRYGRAFVYGFGSSPLYSKLNSTAFPYGGTGVGGNTCSNTSVTDIVANPNPDGCKNDGFVTDFAWGYRIRASLDYPGVFGTSWTATPSIFWSHDVKGYSMDSQFNEGRQTLALGLRMSLNKQHNIDLNYTTYSNSASYDPFKDRDSYSVAYSYTF